MLMEKKLDHKGNKDTIITKERDSDARIAEAQ